MSKANLTVLIQGTTESDGAVQVINSRFEEADAVATFIFKEVDENCHNVDTAIVGAFSTQYFVEILSKMRKVIGEERFLKAVFYSLAKMDDEQDE